jgi:hypothetical protein
MVVDDLNVNGITRVPAKTDSPLIVYPDTVLTLPVSGKSFQPVSRGNPKVFNRICTVKEIEFALSQLL